MKTKHSSKVLSGLIIALLAALISAIVVLLARTVAIRLEGYIERLLIFILLWATLFYALKFYTNWINKSKSILRVLHKIAVDPSLGDLSEFGKDLQTAIADLSNSIKELRQDKRQTETVFSNMADGVIAVNSDGQITIFNNAARLIFSHVNMDAIGKRLEDTDIHPEIARVASECKLSGEYLSSEIVLPGLPQRVVGINATPFDGLDSNGRCAMVLLHDLSEIRRHEKNQKEFVSNVSHELRTPITSVRVTAEALLGGAKNDEDLVDRFLGTILSESDRLSALIDDLLDIAKRDSGIIRVQKSEVSISDIVNLVVRLILPQAELNNIRIKTDLADGLMGYCDNTQIMQLLRNLVENAIKYTPSDGQVEVKAYETKTNLMISVKDTGIGIPQGEVDRIFERFYRVDKARSRRLGGTGLGLSIVKDIVKSHGGEIFVETQLGKGSTFTVVLPIQNVDLDI